MDSDMIIPEEFDRNQKRNAYYRDGYRNMLWIASVQVVFILVLSSVLMFYVSTKERTYRYFSENTEGRRVKMTSLPSPNMEKTAVTKWAVQSVAQIMTFGFNDVEEQFSTSFSFFTEKGWSSFKKTLIDGKLLKDMHEKQLIFTSIPIETPLLIKEGLVVDKYIWKFDIPLMITYRAAGKNVTLQESVKLSVEKVPTSNNPAGLGISEFYIF